MFIFVAHTGKTLELDVQSSVRVEAVQQALVELTGIPVEDQVVICDGARLDPARSLAAYKLPVEEENKSRDVFLYDRSHLREVAVLPDAETLPDMTLQAVPAAQSVHDAPHVLDDAESLLVRMLPEYARRFRRHLQQGRAYADLGSARHQLCQQLLSEQEVQAMAIDAARTNVEVHFSYIQGALSEFSTRFAAHSAQHADVLGRFDADMRLLAATPLHPAVQSPGTRTLMDLIPAARLRDTAASCAKNQRHFAAKVDELELLFGALKSDVESLFMQAPRVDLASQGLQMDEARAHTGEQASVVQALAADLGRVERLVAQATEQASAPGRTESGVQPLDACGALETMSTSHTGPGGLLARLTAADEALQHIAQHSMECKNHMTRDVFSQLQAIAGQQSKIRDIKNKLALFREALSARESDLADLLLLRRVPAAYKHSLAECVRRGAFLERYAHSAAKLAEGMGKFREKEVAMRDCFKKHVERYMPAEMLERMGLIAQPPHCQVTVPAAEGRLLRVGVDDVRRVQLPWSAASLSAGERRQEGQASDPPSPAVQPVGAEESGGDCYATLQMENARLRAELAAGIAMECVRAAEGPAAARSAATRGSTDTGVAQADQASKSAAKLSQALKAKDDFITMLEGELAASQRQLASCADRIRGLEAQSHLATQAHRAAQAQESAAGQAPERAASGAALPSTSGLSVSPSLEADVQSMTLSADALYSPQQLDALPDVARTVAAAPAPACSALTTALQYMDASEAAPVARPAQPADTLVSLPPSMGAQPAAGAGIA